MSWTKCIGWHETNFKGVSSAKFNICYHPQRLCHIGAARQWEKSDRESGGQKGERKGRSKWCRGEQGQHGQDNSRGHERSGQERLNDRFSADCSLWSRRCGEDPRRNDVERSQPTCATTTSWRGYLHNAKFKEWRFLFTSRQAEPFGQHEWLERCEQRRAISKFGGTTTWPVQYRRTTQQTSWLWLSQWHLLGFSRSPTHHAECKAGCRKGRKIAWTCKGNDR